MGKQQRPIRLGWRAKAILPVVGVLILGVVDFMAVTWSIQGPERRDVQLIASLGAVAIAGVVMVVLAVLVHSPLVELAQKIERVRDGDLDTTVNFAVRDDDIGELGRNFNAMVRELRASREEIERLHRTQMSRAEHLATLGELAAGLAHEIRNPLAGIAGVAEIIGRDLPPTSPARQVVGEIQREVRQIDHFVSELLTLARPKPPEFRPADLNATVEHACTLARQQATARGLELRLSPAPSLAAVEHDPGQITEVALNLMLNAIQATPPGGSINVSMSAENGHALITVADDGEGITPEHLALIFRPFFTTKKTGTGLGLSLARRIVEEHGGRIAVDSAPREGARFVVRLPFRRPAAPKEEEAWLANAS